MSHPVGVKEEHLLLVTSLHGEGLLPPLPAALALRPPQEHGEEQPGRDPQQDLLSGHQALEEAVVVEHGLDESLILLNEGHGMLPVAAPWHQRLD